MGIGMDSGSESITGTGGATNFSIGVSTLNQPFLSDTATGDTYEYLDGTYTSGCSPSCQATETGNASNLATSVSAVLAPLRASTPTTPIADLPAGVTDIRLYRVQPQNSIVALKVSS
jgi:hypothetical protein